ncbi:hypothetical protein HRM2_29960 [Desulforapulum autotrophicum HRM2]|uniref:Glycosyltransferase 2-like domain-containing protein n=1 Tax=Desulforapulum autotrophicum (strain ATCC 43914 / DSM 3382 / VKM B-1955 / HRM2) TaxID=177437 RepID=C0QK53_DESAH|nr:glycosyltransferase [Desulforapulum autotrophicum]ACN16079.1 hypothetical protein HRM2_29960 [Desulforapulum autotrophicum HRM2]
MEQRPIYDYNIDLTNENTSHVKLLKMVERDQDVLEIGCATGYMTRFMKETLNCCITVIEIDGVAAGKAEPFCDKLIVGNVEDVDLAGRLGKKKFDVILMADLLEHLQDAHGLLERLKDLLKETGYLLISLPNGAHGSIALELLDGKWEYRSDGLLDRTHLHFYDKEGFTSLLDKTGFLVSRMDRVIIHPRDTEMKTPWDSYPRDITAYIEKVNPEYQTYQFILKVYPATTMGWKKGLEDALIFEKQKKREIEKQFHGMEKELAVLRGAVAGFDGELKKREEEYLQGLNRELARLEVEKAQIHRDYKAELQHVEVEKDEIHGGYRVEIERLKDEAEKHKAQQVADQEHDRKEICRLQLEAGDLKRKESRLFQRIKDFENKKNELLAGIERQTVELESIRSSFVWQLIQKYRTIIDRLMPQGTKRRRLYQLVSLSLVVLFRDGPVQFFKRVAIRIPHYKNTLFSYFHLTPNEDTSLEDKWSPLEFPAFESIEVSIVIPVFNKCKYTFACLKSIVENTTDVSYEVIVVDNASEDATNEMLSKVTNIKVVTNTQNLGFVEACNKGADASRARFILFLNNDTKVTTGWLGAMCAPFNDPNVGIVGAKLIYPDGRLQEAGNIIWQDGTGWNYGRGDNPDLPQYSYLKSVDYCSGACLQIRRDLWTELGGFDRRYAPAYYEDTDLCFAVREKGFKVIFQPEAKIIHYEGISSGTDITKGYKKYQQVNQGKFIEKWQAVLREKHFRGKEDLYLARERGGTKRALVVDHYAPTYDMDSGSLRIFSLMKIFQELGYKVVFWPENRAYDEQYTRDLQRLGIEAQYGDLNFEEYLKENGDHFDIILLSRPHVAVNFIHAAKTLSNARVIYDTVDLHYIREGRKARYEAENAAREWKDLEFFLAHHADDTLVVSDIEKEILDKEGFEGKVSVISNIHTVEPSINSFEKREGLMFIGGFKHLPNEDGMLWFVNAIFPDIQKQIPGIHLDIVGSYPTERINALASDDITVTGYVKDVSPYFEKSRVFVSPLRYGAGVKGKIGQSLGFGLPVVTTHVGAEGMGLTHGRDVLIGETDSEFAEKVVQLYRDRRLWESLSINGRIVIEEKYSPSVMREKLIVLIKGKDGN